MKLEVFTPQRRFLSTEVDAVTAPGSEGSFGVWPKHAPMVAELTAGTATYTSGGKRHELKISGGFAEVTGDRVTLLVESAEEKS